MGQFAIALVGALAGVLFTEWRRNRRDERLAAERLRSAARMVSAELGMAAIVAESALGGPTSRLADLPTAAWAAHGADLAAAMSDADFYTVTEAATKVGVVRTSVARVASNVVIDVVPTETTRPMVDLCRRAQDVLARLAYPTAVAGSSTPARTA